MNKNIYEKETSNNYTEDIKDLKKHEGLWQRYISAIAASTSSNNIIQVDEPSCKTYRTYIKPREYGNFIWRFWHRNAVDSTWDDGSYSRANLKGGNWFIEAAFIADGGTEIDGSIVAETEVQVTFNGDKYKNVEPGEEFWSDSISFNIPQDHYIAFTWTIRTKSAGKVIPFNIEGLLMSAYVAPGNCADQQDNSSFALSEGCTVLPHLIAIEKPVSKRICFIGDSITQGVRTKMDKYEYWVSKIAKGLGSEYGIWNIGSGWSRAYDAATTNGTWLSKAKHSDEVIICLGVNDIGTGNRKYDELYNDLSTIVQVLKDNNPQCNVIMFTVPPFDFSGEQEKVWRAINDTIRTNPPKGVDRVFDIAKVLSCPSPNDNLARKEFKSGEYDAHPNGLAGTAVADAFLSWYFEN